MTRPPAERRTVALWRPSQEASRALIYKLFRIAEWAAARGAAFYAGSEVDLKDGYIHFSTAAQAAATAAKYFSGEETVVLAEIDSDRLQTVLKWEPSRDGALFPHLYGALPLSAVTRTWVLGLGSDGRHVFPSGLS